MTVHATDVTVVAAAVRFRTVTLDHPFVISGRPIDAFTVAEVDATVTDTRGRTATGTGATVLSVPWAWPESGLDPAGRDAALRALTEEIAAAAVGLGPGDPLELWHELDAGLADRLRPTGERPAVPPLAGQLALGAVDNAVHDAWARAAGLPAAVMYGPDHLGRDLARLDASLAGHFPGAHLVGPAAHLPVQHVVGLGDPLADDDAAAGGGRPLTAWLASDGIRSLKVKVTGADPVEDARRVAAVHTAAVSAVGQVEISLDPNEGYEQPDAALEMLDALATDAPAAALALTYLEQPVPRDAEPDPAAVRRLTARVPALLDEGFTDVAALPHLREQGWSGVVVKAAKGQSPALIAHTYAQVHGLALTVQDLTTVGLALAHSARLAASLRRTWDHLEYNSRQYAPGANAALAGQVPDLVTVRDGHVRPPHDRVPGLYQVASS